MNVMSIENATLAHSIEMQMNLMFKMATKKLMTIETIIILF